MSRSSCVFFVVVEVGPAQARDLALAPARPQRVLEDLGHRDLRALVLLAEELEEALALIAAQPPLPALRPRHQVEPREERHRLVDRRRRDGVQVPLHLGDAERPAREHDVLHDGGRPGALGAPLGAMFHPIAGPQLRRDLAGDRPAEQHLERALVRAAERLDEVDLPDVALDELAERRAVAVRDLLELRRVLQLHLEALRPVLRHRAALEGPGLREYDFAGALDAHERLELLRAVGGDDRNYCGHSALPDSSVLGTPQVHHDGVTRGETVLNEEKRGGSRSERK
jgi:hypothetical protein